MVEIRRHHDAMRGFTLLEILIVLLIFGLILVGLTSGVRFADRSWATQQLGINRTEDSDAVRNTIREIIESGRGFAGSAGVLNVEGPLPRALGRAGVFDITIKTVSEQLVLSWQPHVRNPDPSDAGQATLLTGISGFSVAYFVMGDRGAAGAWGGNPPSAKPPGLVRIALDLGKNRFWSPLVVAPNIENVPASR
jgi:general secretion pathway protein J